MRWHQELAQRLRRQGLSEAEVQRTLEILRTHEDSATPAAVPIRPKTDPVRRGAEVLGIGFVDDTEIAKYTTETVRIPRVDPFIAPILAVIPMQLLAYYTSIKRGNDVDKPRNLAKSVTVE